MPAIYITKDIYECTKGINIILPVFMQLSIEKEALPITDRLKLLNITLAMQSTVCSANS